MSHWDKLVVNTKHTDYFDTPYDEIGQLSTNKGNNKITEFRTIFQRESQNS
jgi:hypothetical protein